VGSFDSLTYAILDALTMKKVDGGKQISRIYKNPFLNVFENISGK